MAKRKTKKKTARKKTRQERFTKFATNPPLLQVLSEEELSPRTRGRCRFDGAESGSHVLLDVGRRELAEYQRRMETRLERIRTVCLRNNIDHVLLEDSVSLEETVFGVLRDRGIVR